MSAIGFGHLQEFFLIRIPLLDIFKDGLQTVPSTRRYPRAANAYRTAKAACLIASACKDTSLGRYTIEITEGLTGDCCNTCMRVRCPRWDALHPEIGIASDHSPRLSCDPRRLLGAVLAWFEGRAMHVEHASHLQCNPVTRTELVPDFLVTVTKCSSTEYSHILLGGP